MSGSRSCSSMQLRSGPVLAPSHDLTNWWQNKTFLSICHWPRYFADSHFFYLRKKYSCQLTWWMCIWLFLPSYFFVWIFDTFIRLRSFTGQFTPVINPCSLCIYCLIFKVIMQHCGDPDGNIQDQHGPLKCRKPLQLYQDSLPPINGQYWSHTSRLLGSLWTLLIKKTWSTRFPLWQARRKLAVCRSNRGSRRGTDQHLEAVTWEQIRCRD